MSNVLNIEKIIRFRAFVLGLYAPSQFLFEAEFRDGTIRIVQFPAYLRLRSGSDCLKIGQIMHEVAKAKELVDWNYFYHKYGVRQMKFLHLKTPNT